MNNPLVISVDKWKIKLGSNTTTSQLEILVSHSDLSNRNFSFVYTISAEGMIEPILPLFNTLDVFDNNSPVKDNEIEILSNGVWSVSGFASSFIHDQLEIGIRHKNLVNSILCACRYEFSTITTTARNGLSWIIFDCSTVCRYNDHPAHRHSGAGFRLIREGEIV